MTNFFRIELIKLKINLCLIQSTERLLGRDGLGNHDLKIIAFII